MTSYFTKIIKSETNKSQTTVYLFKTKESCELYLDKEKDLNKSNAIPHSLVKLMLRNFATENRKMLDNSSIGLSYITDEGLKFLAPINITGVLNQQSLNQLLADPKDNRNLPSDIGSSTLTSHRSVFGIQMLILKNKPMLEQPKPKPNTSSQAPLQKILKQIEADKKDNKTNKWIPKIWDDD